MREWGAVLLAGALAALAASCAPVAQEGAAPAALLAAASAPNAIEMETTSWGKPVIAWRIDGAGAGTYRTAEDVPGGDFYRYKVVTRRFAAGADGFARLAALLAPLQRPEPKADCGNEIVTDAASTTVHWLRAAGTVKTALYHGDLCAAARPGLARVNEAHALVARWAKDAPVSMVEDVKPSGG